MACLQALSVKLLAISGTPQHFSLLSSCTPVPHCVQHARQTFRAADGCNSQNSHGKGDLIFVFSLLRRRATIPAAEGAEEYFVECGDDRF